MPKYKRLGAGSAHAFRLVVKFYNVFTFLATCLAILSLAAGAFGLSQVDSFARSILTIVAAVKLELSSRSPQVQYERMDLAMAWMPVFFLNLVVLEVEVARLLWHSNNYPDQLAYFLVIEVAVLLIMATVISICVRRKINGLLLDLAHLQGQEDNEAVMATMASTINIHLTQNGQTIHDPVMGRIWAE
ncbi:hypothetical protein FBULB1_1417 [Fusarium bulbicola]|nr:hypothetical protein FBULB1_1417 [Fusarium bulbicola]